MPQRRVETATLGVVCLATFMLLFNVASPIVGLAEIGRDLDADFTQLQWVLSGYALTLASFVLLAGSLADRYGHRRLFVLGLGLYAAASVGCLAATGPLLLDLARGVQGVAAAILFASSLALLASVFSGSRRARALGIWGATIALAFAVGPVIGGMCTEWASWRLMFAVNLPIAVIAGVVAVARVPESRNPSTARLDWPGAVLLTVCLGALVLGVIRGNAEG